MYFHLTRLADDEVRHAALFECPSCGSLYEVFPEAKALPERVTAGVARQRFPGAL